MITRLGRLPAAEQVPLPSPPLELEACYRYCEALARARHHNFPVASLFVPRKLRPHILAVYAFARTADDFADEPAYEGRRSQELDRWEERLERSYFGEPAEHPVFVALADTVRKFELPITEFLALLSGFRADLETTRYATETDLAAYTALAAAPVGHLILYLGGYRDPVLHRYTDDLAAGLAMAKLLQDIPADAQRGRIYIPAENLRHFGVSEDDLLERRQSPEIGSLIAYEVARVRAHLMRGRPLVDSVGHDLAIEMAMIWLGGMQILDKIEEAGGKILQERPRLSSIDKASVVSRALAWRGGSLRKRGQRYRWWRR